MYVTVAPISNKRNNFPSGSLKERNYMSSYMYMGNDIKMVLKAGNFLTILATIRLSRETLPNGVGVQTLY